MRPPDKKRGPVPGRDQAGAESRETGSLETDDSTAVIVMPSPGWHVAMRRAHAIRRYKGRAKVLAVRHWRVAVVDALGVRP